MNYNRFEGYRGFCIERLKAQSKKIKATAEETLELPVSAIYAVGGVAGEGDFDDTSDVELVFEIDENLDVDPYLEDELQAKIENSINSIGCIRSYIGSTDPNEKRIRIG